MRISPTGRCRSGFTLLELIIVIFIISLLSGLVFPSFYGLGERGLKADARKTASMLRFLNDSAQYAKETYSVQFDLQTGSVLWKGPDGEKADRLKYLAGINLQSKGEIKEGQVTVFFSPLGIQENIDVRLRDKDSEVTVSFNAISGRAKIITDENR